MGSVEEEAQLTTEKEQWAQEAASRVVGLKLHPAIDYEIALGGARCATLWVDKFKEMVDEEVSGTEEELLSLLRKSQTIAIEQSEGLLRYPSGVPTIRSIIALNESFILAFDEEEQPLLRDFLYGSIY